jgi:hypothetical protein
VYRTEDALWWVNEQGEHERITSLDQGENASLAFAGSVLFVNEPAYDYRYAMIDLSHHARTIFQWLPDDPSSEYPCSTSEWKANPDYLIIVNAHLSPGYACRFSGFVER